MFKTFFLAITVFGAMLLAATPAYCSSAPTPQVVPIIYNYTIFNGSFNMLTLDNEKEGSKTRILGVSGGDAVSRGDTSPAGTIYINLQKNNNSRSEQIICTKNWPSQKKSVRIVVYRDHSCTFDFAE